MEASHFLPPNRIPRILLSLQRSNAQTPSCADKKVSTMVEYREECSVTPCTIVISAHGDSSVILHIAFLYRICSNPLCFQLLHHLLKRSNRVRLPRKKAAHRLSRFSRNSNHHLVSNKLVRSQKRADLDARNNPFQNALEVQGAISDSLPCPARRRPGTPSPVAPRASAMTMLAPPCKCQFSLCKVDRGFRSLYPQQVGDIRPTAHRQ